MTLRPNDITLATSHPYNQHTQDTMDTTQNTGQPHMSAWGTHQADLFDGETYEPSLDRERLGKQARAVYEVMIGGYWFTLRQIVLLCNEMDVWPSEAGVSARVRDFRKDKFGSHIVNRRRSDASGVFEYQLIDPKRISS